MNKDFDELKKEAAERIKALNGGSEHAKLYKAMGVEDDNFEQRAKLFFEQCFEERLHWNDVVLLALEKSHDISEMMAYVVYFSMMLRDFSSAGK